MHIQRNRILFFGSTVLAGLASMALYRYMMENCFDRKGLLIAGNLPGRLLWVVGIGFVVGLLALLTTIGGDGTYEDNFPRSLPSGVLLLAAGGALAWSVPQLGLEADTEQMNRAAALCTTALPWLAAASMGALGLFRMAGKRPTPLFGAVVCLFDMLMLVSNYRLWSADPQLQDYAYQLLAGVLLMLCAFHRTCCDAGIIQRKKLLATGLLAAVCAMAALGGDFMPGFFLSAALWGLGCVCEPSVLPPDPEEDEAEAPEQPAEPERSE